MKKLILILAILTCAFSVNAQYVKRINQYAKILTIDQLTITTSLTVTGTVTITGSITVAGNLTVDSLICTGGATFGDTVAFANDIQLYQTKKLILDGDADDGTYIVESSADVFDTYVGGVIATRIAESTTITGTLTDNWSTTGTLTAGTDLIATDQLAVNTTINANYIMELQVDDSDNKGGLLIDFDKTGDYIALLIDGESTAGNTFKVTGKNVANFTQDINDGRGLYVYRNLGADDDTNPLAIFDNDNAANTMPLIYGKQDGTGDILQLYDGAVKTFWVADGGNVTVVADLTAGTITSDATIKATTMTGNVAQQTITLGVGATTLAVTSNIVQVTGDGGGNTVTTATGAIPGIYTFIFVDGNVTFTDTDAHTANTFDLTGNLTFADDQTLTMVYDGTSFYQIATSVN